MKMKPSVSMVPMVGATNYRQRIPPQMFKKWRADRIQIVLDLFPSLQEFVNR